MAAKMESRTERELAVRAAEVPPDFAERRAIVDRAINGEADARGEALAVACVRAYPADVRVNYLSTLTPILDQISDGNAVLRQILVNEALEKRREVAGENPTPLESLLAERVVACQLQVAHYERIIASNHKAGVSIDQAAWMHRKADGAHKRLLSSVKALAQVRRLHLPAVQINVADKQVNVAQAQVNAGMQQANAAAVQVNGLAAR